MTGRQGSRRILAGLVVGAVLGVSGLVAAQQPPPPDAPPPPVSPPPGAGPQLPPAPAEPGGGSGGSGFRGPGSFSGGAPGQPMGFSGPVPSVPPNGAPVRRFIFTIEPNTPVTDLLPTPPQATPSTGPLLTDDLSKVPEVMFKAQSEKGAAPDKLMEATAHQLAKMNHLNAKKSDAFMAALLESRPDLAGLPFQMGDACRTAGERTRQFAIAVSLVRQSMGGALQSVGPGGPPPAAGGLPQTGPGGPFWPQFTMFCNQSDTAATRPDKALAEHVAVARIAALMQMLAPETAELRLGLVKYLAGVSHVEATKALAKLAIFSTEDDVRQAALDALKVRRERDYTDVLVNGLRYPFPAVARRSADAIAKLERNDLIPELLSALEAGDPRLPVTKEVGGKKVAVVREMVKMNHHRNCMMCHSPGIPGSSVSPEAITAEVPVQGQALPTPAQGYNQSSPDLLVRIDVTYLRQDFSTMLSVADAHPWPESQRFDFFVRERKLTGEEAVVYREKLTPKEAGVLSPYHQAALAALRDLTGKDTAPTAEAWRTLLAQPRKPAGVPE